ncbi:MAG: 3-hydroxyacyl-CoA dehydrogenase family protein [Sandaracinaceae bacterium]
MSLSAIAIVGAGPQGLSIAEAVAEADLPVLVVCTTGAREELAARRIDRTLAMRVDVGDLSRREAEAIRARVTFSRELADAEGCDLVIESTVGDPRMRRAILATVESRISRGAVLASNSPAEELPALAEVLRRTDQFIGLHFAHPASHTPLVEVLPLPETAPGAVFACETLVRWMNKQPVERFVGHVAPVLRSIRAAG